MNENTINVNAAYVAAPLSALKSRLAAVLDLFDPTSRIFYVDYPVHQNVGDLLISAGTERFFSDNNLAIHERYSILNMPEAASLQADADATFLCHGGGNFGDLYFEHQNLRERLVEAFPRARIIFLPQSLHYSSKEKERESLKKIAKHPNYHILVRDKESLDALHSADIAHASMMPDMAHQLWNIVTPTTRPEAGNNVYFLRKDQEATTPPGALAEPFSRDAVDWSDIVSAHHSTVARSTYYLLKTGARTLSARASAALWYSARDAMIDDAVRYFSRHDHVYTNRLHAMLLALLLGHDVTAFDNSYGKLSRYINAWL